MAGRRNCCAARVRLSPLIPVPATGRTLSRTRMAARRLRPSCSAASLRHASRRGVWLSYALRASPRRRAPAAALFALQPALRMRLWRSAGSSASIAPGRAVPAWRRRASVHPGAPPRRHVPCPRPLRTGLAEEASSRLRRKRKAAFCVDDYAVPAPPMPMPM